ncbi:hypothetical protein EVAR_68405_1 [Eumeta japonica]|uniref:Uncharacterized protein n=1 Tax=Eumeta variegata TaxID=151549 RepID=A0A4C2A4S9_EUMVA|nr:hypothetical protein EVAR_68405_1 [Eumeta japonica]
MYGELQRARPLVEWSRHYDLIPYHLPAAAAAAAAAGLLPDIYSKFLFGHLDALATCSVYPGQSPGTRLTPINQIQYLLLVRNLCAQTSPLRDGRFYGTKIDSALTKNYIDIQYTINGCCQKLAVRSYVVSKGPELHLVTPEKRPRDRSGPYLRRIGVYYNSAPSQITSLFRDQSLYESVMFGL